MTAIWGPMAWMTLHSISTIYPNNPTQTDKQILQNYLKNFEETITCDKCKHHFESMLRSYSTVHPDWNSSKFKLFVMICRMHNQVNIKLDKPTYKTVIDCFTAYEDATKVVEPRSFRTNYVNYLIRQWIAQQSGQGNIMAGYARIMQKINAEYWNNLSPESIFTCPDFDPSVNVMEQISENAVGKPIVHSTNKLMGIKIVGGKFKLT